MKNNKIFSNIIIIILSLEVCFLYVKNLNYARLFRNYRDNKVDTLIIPNENIFNIKKLIINGGTSIDLMIDNNNKEYVLLYFSTSCANCVDAIPVWNDIFVKYRSHCNIIGITRDYGDNLNSFIKYNHVSFPVYSIKPNCDVSFLTLTPRTIFFYSNGDYAKTIDTLSSVEGDLLNWVSNK